MLVFSFFHLRFLELTVVRLERLWYQEVSFCQVLINARIKNLDQLHVEFPYAISFETFHWQVYPY